jgi:NADH:ubiquinone oxidoreductase subunit 4 (subunit M)
MDMTNLRQIPWLSLLVLLPLVTGVVLLAIPKGKIGFIRWLSFAAGLVTFVLSVGLFIGYDETAAGYQLSLIHI